MDLFHGGQRRPLPKPIPEKLREAREARGYTVDAFAEHLDVTRQTVAQYETGQIAPSGEVMGKIIAITGQPPAFFVTPRERSGIAGSPFWRSLKRMEGHHRRRIARRLQWARDVTTFVERFIELPEVKLPVLQFDSALNDDEQIEAAAEALRVFWGLGRGPIKDLAPVLESNGIILVREPVDCKDMDAVSVWLGGRPFILLSSDVSSGPRLTFNLAHELAHVLLHAGVELTAHNIDRIEKQANRFAGAFLLPRSTFSQEVLCTSIGYFKSLKERWGVAISAMAYRARELGIINANQHAYLMRQMNIQGIRKEEPLDDVISVRNPSILAESIKMLIEHGVQTRDQIATTLSLNLADVESLCGVPKGFLDTTVVKFQPRPRSPDQI